MKLSGVLEYIMEMCILLGILSGTFCLHDINICTNLIHESVFGKHEGRHFENFRQFDIEPEFVRDLKTKCMRMKD